MALLTMDSHARAHRRRMRFGWLAPVGALLVSGCLREEIVEPVRMSVAVHSMAVVGSSAFGVALSQISLIGTGEPIDGATIRLLRDSSTVQLIEAGPASTYCFSSSPDGGSGPGGPGGNGGSLPFDGQCYAANLGQPIAAGETLRLEIELTDGTVIHGSTVTPALPEQVTPAGDEPVEVTFHLETFEFGGFTVHDSDLAVSWQSSDGRPAEVRVVPRRLFYDGTGIEPDDCDLYSSFARGRHARSPARVDVPSFCHGTSEDPVWDSVYVDLAIAAYDESYVRYAAAFHEEGTGVVLEHAASGIGLVAGDAIVTGVFGSAAPTEVPLTLHSVILDERATVFDEGAVGD